MKRLILAFVLLFASMQIGGCSNNCEHAGPDASQTIGGVELYTYSPDEQYFLGDARPFILPADTVVHDALASLGRRLAETYFSRTYTGKATAIYFEVLSIDTIATPSRPLRIAVINMIDVHKDALRYFFQGSAGAQTTFYMLAATFTQPHLSPPLLDGLVLLYNGKLLPELDHISLAGILIPRSVEHVAQRAIHATKRKAVISHHTMVPVREPTS